MITTFLRGDKITNGKSVGVVEATYYRSKALKHRVAVAWEDKDCGKLAHSFDFADAASLKHL